MENEGNDKELEKSVKVSKDVSTSIVMRGLDDLAFLVEHTPAEFFVQKGNACYKSEDYHQAIIYFRQAIKLDLQNAEAQFMMGVMYDNGQGVARDYVEAVKWYREAAEQGLAVAQYNLGMMYQHGSGVPLDYFETLRWYLIAAEQGYTGAQSNLGVMYHNGEGIPQDYAEAVKWTRKAAEQGHAIAQYNLGEMYHYGHGVTLDYTEAAKWYRKAAEQGYAHAQCNLGLMYKNGQNVPQDVPRGPHQISLWERYADGKGIPQDYAEAVKWFRMAAAQGYAEAQYNMGVMYRDGEGVSQDYAEAAKWFRKAAEQGDANAERMAAIASWFDENKWYSPSNPEMQSYADAMSDHFIRTTGKRGKELLDYVRQEVEKRFPEKFAHQIHLFDNEWLRRR